MSAEQQFQYEDSNAGFIDWLAGQMNPDDRHPVGSSLGTDIETGGQLGTSQVLHQYRLPKGNADHKHFPPKGHVVIRSLWHAARIYRWKGNSLAKTGAMLSGLANRLRSAYLTTPSAFAKASEDVLRWGGVYQHNGPWILANAAGLVASVGTVTLLHHPSAWPMPTPLPPARMNSGFTKIYALQLNGFIIFDSRVAAGLALLVLIYAHQTGCIPPIAQDLCVMAGRAGQRTAAGFKMRANEADHLRANLAANWLIEQVFSKQAALRGQWKAHTSGSDEYRALEAALFMLGYDIGGHLAAGGTPARASSGARGGANGLSGRTSRAASSTAIGTAIPLRTLARGISFTAYPTASGYWLQFGNDNSGFFVPLTTLQTIALDFKDQKVAIGASRTSPPAGSLGEYLLENLSGTALASYVAPLIIYLGLAKGVGGHDLQF
jgi:hypothetical protein